MNTATAIGLTPGGERVGPVSSSVRAKRAAVLAAKKVHRAKKPHKAKKVHKTKKTKKAKKAMKKPAKKKM